MADTGQRVGDYEVLAPLGAGGMGRVYKVRNVISNREEAMKILLPDFASDPELAARFMAEIRTLAGLEHPGIAQLRTAFQYNNQFVMVMEYVEGTTLEKLAAQTRVPVDHILDYSTQVLAALSYAHGRGVTHRDIKPANIMITTHGLVKLMDFGIAKSTDDMQLTRPGTTMGSVYYMSPEQVRGGTVDARSDLYSFGVTLYEMLTGRKPFQADTSYSILNAHMNEAPTPPAELDPSISQQLNAIVLRAMAKLPEQRFQTAEEFRTALKAEREVHPTPVPVPAAEIPAPAAGLRSEAWMPATPPTPQYTTPQPPSFVPVPPPPGPPPSAARSHRGLWIGLGAATAILALIVVVALLPRIFSTSASQKPAVATDTTSPASAPAPASPAETQSPAPDQQSSAPPADSAVPPRPSPSGALTHIAKSPSAPPESKKPREPYVSPASAAAVSTSSSETGSAPVPPVPAGPSPREVREAHDRYANLEARADAALAGVEQIRSQQRAQGLDLRGDIVAAMNRLHHQLDEAHQALAQKDLDTANEYMNRADNETAVLEKFLGR
jgi:eukaryotic-like serine/threonine-protein kinase